SSTPPEPRASTTSWRYTPTSYLTARHGHQRVSRARPTRLKQIGHHAPLPRLREFTQTSPPSPTATGTCSLFSFSPKVQDEPNLYVMEGVGWAVAYVTFVPSVLEIGRKLVLFCTSREL